MINQRVNVMNYLFSRGFPVNSVALVFPMLEFAVAYSMVDAVDCLVHAGADLTLGSSLTNSSPRELARDLFMNQPTDAGWDPEGHQRSSRRRVAELCGVDVTRV